MKKEKSATTVHVTDGAIRYLPLLFILLLSVSFSSHCQNKSGSKDTAKKNKTVHSQLLQFSGMVVDKSNLRPIPFAAIIIKTSGYGTVCDNNGYFSFVAKPLDTIDFVAVGYKTNAYLIIPDTVTDRYALIHLMERDTAMLKSVTVYPWPTKEEFKDAFLNLNLHDLNMERARKNMALAQKKAGITGLPMDAEANYLYAQQEENNKLYYGGQLPPENFLNPFAWQKFIQALQNGSLKIQ